MAVAAYSSKIYVTSKPSVSFTNEAMTDSGDHITYAITNASKRYLDKGTAATVETSSDSGTTWTPISNGFTLRYVGAKVIFTSAQAPTLLVRLASGKYFPYATVGQANTAEFSGKVSLEDSSNFDDSATGAKTFVPTLMEAELKCGTFWLNHTRVQNLQDRDLLIGSFVLPTGKRLEGYMWTAECGIKADVGSLVTQDLTFQLTDEFFRA
jgi:hypothetical protein